MAETSKWGLYRGLESDYAPTTTHKDVVYFATDTHKLLMNGSNYGGASEEIALTALDSLNSNGKCGVYQVMNALYKVGTLIVASNTAGNAITQTLIGGISLNNGAINILVSNAKPHIIQRAYASSSWDKWSYINADDIAYLSEQIENLSEDIDAVRQANATTQSELNSLSSSKSQPNGIASLDSDGKLELEQLPNMEEVFAYGIEFDTEVASPTCVRIGNASYHRTLPVQSQMRGCLLADDGTVNAYLPADDWTSSVRDGSKGQVMVELPKYYRKFEQVGTKRRVWLSLLPLDGYHEVKEQYVSAYEATIQRSTSKLSSVVNSDPDYRGGSNWSGYDGTYKSLLGKPAGQQALVNLRKYARNRGVAGLFGCGWNCYLYSTNKDLYWLYVVEYATLNSQADYTAELTSEGYRQGGLGKGVTDMKNWNGYNSYQPIIPCGHTDTLGNNTGCMDYSVPADDEGNVYQVLSVTRYRGIENPFGHLHKWVDGVNVMINPTAANGGNNLSEVYITDDPSLFTSVDCDGYELAGYMARNNGYCRSIIFGSRGDIIIDVASGSSDSKYHCDYLGTSIPTTPTFRGLLVGGAANGGGTAGFVCAYSHRAPTDAYSDFGSRLCFLPR